MASFLFVHGVYHGPECWQSVIDLLQRNGHACHAMALRGHDKGSRASFDFSGIGFRDYFEDVCEVVETMPRETILVGHSLGGMLVRTLMEQRSLAGAVLVSMPTPESLRLGAWKILRAFTWPMLRFMFTLESRWLYHDTAIASRLFFSCAEAEVSDPRWLQAVSSFRESRRLFWDVQWQTYTNVAKTRHVKVIGGGRDFSLDQASFAGVAKLYGAELCMVEGAPHDLMLSHVAELAKELDMFAQSCQ